jgi:hypothetical protein
MKAMSHVVKGAAFAAALALAGCGLTESRSAWPDPVALSDAIESAYAGANFDTLAARYGIPTRSMPSPNGGTLYAWHRTHVQEFATMGPALYSCDLNATVDAHGVITRAWLSGQAGACWLFR